MAGSRQIYLTKGTCKHKGNMQWKTNGLCYNGRKGRTCIKKLQGKHIGNNTNHSLINRVCRFVREDAGGQTGHNFLYIKLVSHLQNVVIDVDVVPLKYNRINV